MNMKETEQYSDDNLAHQEPIEGVSAWQTYNDIDSVFAMGFEISMAPNEEQESVARMYYQVIFGRVFWPK